MADAHQDDRESKYIAVEAGIGIGKVEQLVKAVHEVLGVRWQVPNASIYDPLAAYEEQGHPGIFAHPASLKVNKSRRMIEISACRPVVEACLVHLQIEGALRNLAIEERQGLYSKYLLLIKKR